MEYVQDMLRNKNFSVDDRKYSIAKRRRKELIKDGREIMLDQFDNPSILKLDPPDHSRIRKLVSYGFTNRYISSLESEIKETIDDCLDRTHNESSFDLINLIEKSKDYFSIHVSVDGSSVAITNANYSQLYVANNGYFKNVDMKNINAFHCKWSPNGEKLMVNAN